MKTTKLFFIGLAVLSVGLFTSCEDDELATGPTIEFVAGTDIITSNTTVEVDQAFSFKWIVTKGSADLESFTIRLANNDLDGYPKTDIDQDLYQGQEFITLVSTGIYAYTFIAIDEDGLTETKTITVTVTAAAGPIDSYTNKILGSYDATEGSSFASVDGSILNSTQAAANSDAVDFVYYYGASTDATIAAPSNAAVQTVYAGISGWTVKNATVFGTTTMTGTEFDAVDDDTEIVTTATGLSASNATTLEVGDVIAFETASTSENASKKGLFKVVAVTGTGGTGTITIAVKVQQ